MRNFLGILSLTCLLATASLASAGDFTIFTNDIPPIKWERDGLPGGITGDVLLRIATDAGFKIERGDTHGMPLVDAYRMGKETPGGIVLGLARIPERENDFKWVGPVYDTFFGFIARKSRHIRLTRVKDAENYSIGTIRGGAAEKVAIKFGLPETDITRFLKTDEAIEQLVNGNIDLLVFPKSPAFYYLMQKKVKPGEFEFVYEMRGASLYFAFNKATGDDVIKKFQDALDRLKEPGETGKSPYEALVGKYFMPL